MLEAIKVLDLSRVLPGQYASLHLADLGAQVIKIEDTEKVDYLRGYAHRVKDESAFFLSVNRNKRSIKLNLRQPKGTEVFMRLAAQCDIIIENFRPGVADALGIGYRQVSKINPQIIYCAISGFGQDGGFRERGGHDINFVSMSGILDGNKSADGQPIMPGVSMGGLTGGMYGALAILGALVRKQTTGEGCYLDTAVLDGMLAWVDIANSKGTNLGEQGEEGIICNALYRTQDNRYVSLGALELKFWQNFCQAVNRKDLLAAHRSLARPGNPAYEHLQHLFAQATLEEWQERLGQVDCCFAPVLSGAEALDSEYVQNRDLIMTMQHPTEGLIKQIAFPVKVQEQGQPNSHHLGTKQPLPPPRWGEHTYPVLQEIGLTPDEIAELKQQGIIL